MGQRRDSAAGDTVLISNLVALISDVEMFRMQI